jgi:hypothetical protein
MAASPSQERHQVQLAVYDLSRGMARSLSAQFLGPQHSIEAIPHTGVVVYGREYFFGGGIQSEEPTTFRRMSGIFPIQVLDMGYTRVPPAAFDAWCRTQMTSGAFDMAAYDLLHHNCNDFCQAALQQGLRIGSPHGVPQWILDVPRRFLSSPMGQMVRPMLEQMQLGSVPGATSMAAPLAHAALSVASPSPAANPWANQNKVPTSTTSEEKKTTSTSEQVAESTSSSRKALEILTTHTKPLLANETKTVPLCVSKLLPCAHGEEEAKELRAFGKAVETRNALAETTGIVVSAVLLRCLESGQSVTFSLMMLRHLALRKVDACQPCLDWIRRTLGEDGGLPSPASRAMAWLIWSNALSGNIPASVVAPPFGMSLAEDLDALVELAIQDVSPLGQSRSEVRQAAAAFLYNAVLVGQPAAASADTNVSEAQVSILCAALDCLADESDETVRFRRLLCVGRILVPVGRSKRREAVASLVADLGFAEALQEFVTAAPAGTRPSSVKLTGELLSILSA